MFKFKSMIAIMCSVILPHSALADEQVLSKKFIKYDLALAGAPVGVLKIETRVISQEDDDMPDRFTANAYLKTTGLLGLAFDTKLNAISSGYVNEASYTPVKFETEYTKKGKPQLLKMAFTEDRLTQQIAEPAYRTTDYQIDPEVQEGVMDPVTLGLTGFVGSRAEFPCQQVLTGFDGRKRFEMRFKPHQNNNIEKDKRHCTGEFVRIAGYKAKYMKRPNYEFEVWYKKDTDGVFQASKIAGFTKFGPASATLKN